MPITAETVQIVVDAQIDKALRDLKKTNSTSTKLTETFKKLAGPVAVGAIVAGMVKLGKTASKAASDAEEVESKYNVVFRNISSEAKAMADSLAEDFDLAGSTAQKLLGDTGDLLTGFGLATDKALELSDASNRLALDIGSLQNAHPEDVSKALISAFTGEREALKTYGVVISEAMVKAEMLKQEKEGLIFVSEQEAKIQATLAIATRQSKNAIGNYAETAESAANTQRRLEQSSKSLFEAYGVGINETMTPLKALLADIASAWATVLDNQNKARAFFKDIGDGVLDTKLSADELRNVIAGVNSELADSGSSRELLKQRDIAEEQLAIAIERERLEEDARRRFAGQENEEIKIKAEVAKLDAERKKDMEALAVAFDKTGEANKRALEEQIAYFEGFQQVGRVVFILDELRESLADITGENEALELASDTAMERMEERANRNVEIFNMVRDAKLEQLQEEVIAEQKASDEKIRIAQLEAQAKMQIMTSGFSIANSLLDANSEANKENAERNFHIAKALGLAEVAIHTAIGIASQIKNGPLAVAGAIATGAAQGVAIATQAPPAFATGTKYRTTSEEDIRVGDNASGQEQVTVKPTNGSGGDSGRFRLVSPAGDMLGWIQREGFDNGVLRVPEGNII